MIIREAYMGITIFIVKLLFSQKPLESILDVSKKKILVIVPHPDDEILGLGGIILQMLRLGGKVHLVYLTDGESCGSWPDREEIKNRRTALSVEVCDRLGLLETDVSRLHLPDGSLTLIGQKGFTETAQRVAQIIEILQPDEVFATHTRDYMNHDHLACAQIAYEAIRQSVAKPQLWYYWVWAWYNLWPWQLIRLNHSKIFRITIKGQLAQKSKLIGLYFNPLTPKGIPWSGQMRKPLWKAMRQPFEVIEKIDVKY